MDGWFAEASNWWFLVLAVFIAVSALRVVTSTNVVHAALFLVAALAGTAGLFLVLGAQFVAWVLVLVYIGAVIVLFLFGIMITRAPTGPKVEVDNPHKGFAATAAVLTFAVMVFSSVSAFGDEMVSKVGTGTPTDLIGHQLMSRFVLPFEIVSFVLLAALIGGITLARPDEPPVDEEADEGKTA
ncbi:MAG: NADH-quinone oxidoreductase subunit J [Gammaproteobacteria bacterium]|nr:NADH-quinone oxidoreductase subunit J [Gammaproteobacteria bacterium]